MRLEKIEVRQHDLTEEEEMKFVRDTAIERRNLTVAQKHKIVTDTEDLIISIYKKGEKHKLEGNKKGAEMTNTSARGSADPQPKHNTNEEIGKMIGTSKATVTRLNKVKREAPEEYEKVVRGEKNKL